MSVTPGQILGKEQTDALKFCRMITLSMAATKFYVCRKESCLGICPGEKWIRNKD